MVMPRKATSSDLETALSLLECFFAEEGFQIPAAQMRTRLEKMLKDDGSAVFLAWFGDEAVGVATVTTSSGIELGLSAELEDLYILPEARRSGVGGALIASVKDWCRARGCTLVSVVVTPEGQVAHNLIEYYHRRGFEETGRSLMFAHLDG
jgi:aminoglycoside 6'-N-acetyltransferase I